MKRGLVQVAALLAPLVASPASAAWQQASTRHFVVYSDDRPEKVRDFATKLERFDEALRVLRGVPDAPVSPSMRVSVYVVPSASAVARLAGEQDVAGFYVPRASQSVAFVPRADASSDFSALTVLLHEYTHHFTYSTWGRFALPAWLVEGMAEYHSQVEFPASGDVILGGVAKYRAYGLLSEDVLPMKRLLTASPSDLTREQTAVFYARGWLLTHYFTTDAARREKLGRYIGAINAGRSPKDAMAELGDPVALDRALDAYVHQRYISAFVLPAKMVPMPQVEVRPLSAGEAAVMPARIRSVRGVTPKTAPAVAEQMRRLAAPFPTDAGAQNALAEAEYDAGQYDASAAAAARALAADPKSVHALMYAGLAATAQAAADRSSPPERYRAARAWFLRANRADTEYAWPLQAFYGSFVAAHATPTANAQAGLLYAHELAPFDEGLTMTAAYVLLRQGKADEAATVLKPVAYDPHGGAISAAATATMSLIRDKGGAAALAALDGPTPPAPASKPAG